MTPAPAAAARGGARLRICARRYGAVLLALAALAGTAAGRVQVPAGGVQASSSARAAVAAIKQSLPACWERVRPIVRRGAVTLEGTLDWNYERDLAEGAVRSLTGVSCVINAITLTLGTQLLDTH